MSLNGSVANASTRPSKSASTNLAPPAPASAPPAPPSQSHSVPLSRQNSMSTSSNPPGVNGTHSHVQRSKKKAEQPVDPATMYESLRTRIAALEEEEVLEEEEEKKYSEEAQKSVKGMEVNAIHTKYIELFAELKRVERDHAKEKQKLLKDKDVAKSQFSKVNQTKTKMENLARELQRDNKKLREDTKRLAQSVEEAREEIAQMKIDMTKRIDKARLQDTKFREMPDIVVKVVCRYRAELFFKISRKTKLSRLFTAWTDRMENTTGKKADSNQAAVPSTISGTSIPSLNGSTKDTQAASTQFIFTHSGRMVEADQTPEEAGIDDGDEILAVEMMDLTEGPEDWEDLAQPSREKLKKNWTENPREAKRSLEELFDGVVRERLKEILRQYELRERHFECVIRSKELEVLLSRARAAEQKQLAENDKTRAEKLEEENNQLKKDFEDAQHGQSILINKLIAYCKEPNTERNQRLFASLREELEKRQTGKRTKGVEGG